MTLDEAIKHNIDMAERYERFEDSHDEKLKEECLKCAEEYRQLAEWLTELKEAKRLLKSAVEDIRWLTKWHDPCELCGLTDEDGDCPVDLDKGIDCDDIYKWRLEGEVEKLIGGEEQ
ncbi:MAG: hypothetical protein J6U00_03855 [Ruminococcus sp.]|uniref:hypothetical protein n=1 Tax=Ruminococcus sp. TaxID=41978 RepID=UPI001B23676F|nr:hypothetical protein [Ruminococcus sp.]MBO7473126.1 hypothetical protein [Ruminococcus sp.]